MAELLPTPLSPSSSSASEERAMSMYRLTNTTQTEVAPSLPLPSLPIFFGASTQKLSIVEDPAKLDAQVKGSILSQASKIAELLAATDISYLSLRNDAKNVPLSISPDSDSLLAAVLQCDSEAFSFSAPGSPSKQKFRNISTEKRSNQHVGALMTQNQNPSKSSSTHPTEELRTPVSPRKKRAKRKEQAAGSEAEQKFADLDKDAAVGILCEFLEEIFEKVDLPGDGDDEDSYWSSYEVGLIADEIAAAHTKNIIQLVPIGLTVKLLSLLDRQVKLAQDRPIDDEDDGGSENFTIVMSALESIHTILIIMTHTGMPKQVYKEEIIDRLIEFSRYQIVHTIFTSYDPMYRQLHKSSGGAMDDDMEDDDIDPESGAVKKGHRKSKVSKFRKSTLTKVSSSVSSVLHKLCSTLTLMKELLSVGRLPDNTVLQLIRTVLATLGVDNIQLLQLKAIGIACSVFSLYPQHRTAIMDEIFALLWKLPSSKRNLRAYHLPEDDSKQVQMLTALLLQLIQCSVNLPEAGSKVVASGGDTTGGSGATDVATVAVKSFEPAMDACTYFWRNVLQRWVVPKSQDGTDIRGLVENLVVDLLTTLNVPEFPAASLLLQVLCVLLFGSAGLKSKDTIVRSTAIDLLGQIAARLKQDALAISKDTLWILEEALNMDGVSTSTTVSKETCAVCKAGKGVKVMLSCDKCHLCFHGDCIGVTGHDLIGRGWLCHCCLCKKQLTSLESILRSQVLQGKQAVASKQNDEQSIPDEYEVPKTGTTILQQILLNFLLEASNNDTTVVYARRFYLCQWYRDDPQGELNLGFYHVRCNSKAPLYEFGVSPASFSRDSIARIATALGQQRPLARGFDRILERLLVSLQENSPTPRAKALRAVSAIVEVDPGILNDERVQQAVEGRFLDSAISVREAAMELVGRHIASRPDVAIKYFDKIAERIMDTGVSVRKRVIKIIRDICLSKSTFARASDACVRMISRINDDETSIQDLVCKTFYELWFEEQPNQQMHYADGSSVALEVSEPTHQLVDVLRNLPSHQPIVVIIKRSLALDFIPQTTKSSVGNVILQTAVRNRCELMCKSLIESVLKAEEMSSEEAEARALPYVLALHAFCLVDPTLCAPAPDPSRFAVTLQPYLKTQMDNRDAAQLLQSIVFVIDTVLPLQRRPPQSFVEELERDLRQLIVRYSFLTVVHACIKCLCTLGKVAVKGITSFEFLIRRFFKLLDGWRKADFGDMEKPNVLRCLFCLGLLIRYGSELIEYSGEEIKMEDLLSVFKFYLQSVDFDVKARSLQALGFFFVARPELMMHKDMGRMLEATLSSNADSRIKLQTLRNFYDYLIDVEEKMALEEDANDSTSKQKSDSGRAVPVAAGAGDSNICGGIAQLYWDNILDRSLDTNDQVRQASLKVIEIVLRQGLVHPMTCVPHLIALEVDQQESNSKIAHRLLMHMNEKYPSFFESRLGDGLQLCFRFIESGAASSNQTSVMPKLSGNVRAMNDASMSACAKAGVSRMYKLIRTTRLSRNKFLSSVVRKFDVGSMTTSSIPFLLFCTEVLASLPFSLPDEPLYLVFAINRIVQVRAGSIEASIKLLLSEGSLGEVAKQAWEDLAAERQRENENAYNLDAVEPSKTTNLFNVDDTQGVPEEALSRLKVDCHFGVALSLLLRLKRYLKIVYSLSDSRCQAFSPAEPLKPGEILTRHSIKEFSLKDIPIQKATTVRQLLCQFQVFKRLLKEDTMDYSTYTAVIPKKRKRASISQPPPADAEEAGVQVNGHTIPSRPRRKSAGAVIKGGSSGEDSGSDDDYDEDEELSGKTRKTRRASNISQTRGKRQSVN